MTIATSINYCVTALLQLVPDIQIEQRWYFNLVTICLTYFHVSSSLLSRTLPRSTAVYEDDKYMLKTTFYSLNYRILILKKKMNAVFHFKIWASGNRSSFWSSILQNIPHSCNLKINTLLWISITRIERRTEVLLFLFFGVKFLNKNSMLKEKSWINASLTRQTQDMTNYGTILNFMPVPI